MWQAVFSKVIFSRILLFVYPRYLPGYCEFCISYPTHVFGVVPRFSVFHSPLSSQWFLSGADEVVDAFSKPRWHLRLVPGHHIMVFVFRYSDWWGFMWTEKLVEIIYKLQYQGPRPKISPSATPTTVFYWTVKKYRVRHDEIFAQLVGLLWNIGYL